MPKEAPIETELNGVKLLVVSLVAIAQNTVSKESRTLTVWLGAIAVVEAAPLSPDAVPST